MIKDSNMMNRNNKRGRLMIGLLVFSLLMVCIVLGLIDSLRKNSGEETPYIE